MSRPKKLIELAIRRAQFYELESASHGMESTRIRDELDEMADEIRALEEELDIPLDEREF